MTDEDENGAQAEPPALKGDDAIELWQQGQDAWNAWIAAHPGARIDFSGVNFSDHRVQGGPISFARFQFGDGDVNFSDATFGDGHVDFSQTTFGDGSVNFFRATFGDLNFSGVTLGNCNVRFIGASATNIFIRPDTLRSRSLDCSFMSVKRIARINLSEATADLLNISFRDAIFDGPFSLEGELSAPPDLRGTKTVHHVELSELRVTPRRAWHGLSWPPILSRAASNNRAATTESAQFRRLKELAETNRDHAAALRFAADENRAKRWYETGWFASVMDMAFSGFSDYGQSIWRPVAGLTGLTALATVLYRAVTEWGCWADAVSLAAGNAVAFLPQSRAVRADAVDALFGPDPNTWIDLAILGQAALSFVFLFLIGLGLRNRFRL